MIKYLLSFILFLFFKGESAKVPTARGIDPIALREKVASTVEPIMKEFNVPGMAVAVTVGGKHYFFNYGVASRQTSKPVTGKTLFEIGSISKTLTATLASYAQINGNLSLADNVSNYIPSLRGSSFDQITLLHLATHTTGGLPLQVPEQVTDTAQLMAYFKNWQPLHPAGTHRSYSNPGSGLLGLIAAKSLNLPFEEAMEKTLLPGLGMRHTFIRVPSSQWPNYAQGYNRNDEPARVNPGVLAFEAYGIKSDAEDLIHFLDANMQLIQVDEKLKRAIAATHTGYFGIGELTQALMWEQYPYPTEVQALLAGNSTRIIYELNAVRALSPPRQPQPNVYINKTGSTNGFGGYIAFIPARKVGLVILANKNYPIDSRVKAAHAILTHLVSDDPASGR